ncbi:hypothetical protein Salat_2392900 [Sesamum alatum]|uniref:Uncharacterized protein n=1 Tax=Sesamum alatum TaxID=300844 RepID=A0AAE1XXF5_9LAMI|nr:hypothetical protein Salat_2392900 [Sesamum alatum]
MGSAGRTQKPHREPAFTSSNTVGACFRQVFSLSRFWLRTLDLQREFSPCTEKRFLNEIVEHHHPHTTATTNLNRRDSCRWKFKEMHISIFMTATLWIYLCICKL